MVSKIRQNLEVQLSELEALQSMYNREELKVEDLDVLEHVNAFVKELTPDLPTYLDLTVILMVENEKFELCVSLPHEYPESEPELFVRNHKLNKQAHVEINKQLCQYVRSLDRGEPCIFSALCWLQENAQSYSIVEPKTTEHKIVKDESLIRYWIYSHHIYSKTKRREILALATLLKLTGFCMPGKPGIICVEGNKSDCNEWWQTIKAMNWKRIFCKLSEECDSSDFLKFRTFEEKVFQNSGNKCNHMDMGELSRYLDEHKCGYIFKELFGVDSKTSV